MQYIEEKNDLFNYEGKAWLVHCISSDFVMSKGIAIQFNKKYNLKNYIIKNCVKNHWMNKGYCIPVEEFRVFNLVTKKKNNDKPTYRTIEQSLINMKDYAIFKGIHTIAMPIIGCDMGSLDWNIVRQKIKNIFQNTEIKIIICKL